MSQLVRPLPALYTVYVLRSTVRRASLYIGSTPNPPRRLKQHNGDSQGGARRTARSTLRPWEMIALVSGFPSSVAALKFEWALTNPHLSLHIPDESRLAVSTGKKRNGRPRRPATSLKSIMCNLHLLTAVPSFARWPLTLHFFARDVRAVWDKAAEGGAAGTITATAATGDFRRCLEVVEDYPPAGHGLGSEAATQSSQQQEPPQGIHALSVDYTPMKSYVEKAHNITAFEQEGQCVHCHQDLVSGRGLLHPICPHDGCNAVGHLDCWSRHALGHEGLAHVVIPDQFTCPSCGGDSRWGLMMKELSLRVRGAKEVESLLKKKKKEGKKRKEA